jgi:hypothetical protein
MVKLNINLDDVVISEAKALLREYKDVFAWFYKNLTWIPPHIVQHWIELDTTIPLVHQARYWVNPNYAVVVKQDLNKLFTIAFIAPMEETTWLSSIVVVPKKNGKFWMLSFHIFNPICFRLMYIQSLIPTCLVWKLVSIFLLPFLIEASRLEAWRRDKNNATS